MASALSNVCLSASGVLMFSLGAPTRTATASPTLATVGISPSANWARAAAFFITSVGTTPRSNGPPLAICDELGGGPETNDHLVPGRLLKLGSDLLKRSGNAPACQALQFS